MKTRLRYIVFVFILVECNSLITTSSYAYNFCPFKVFSRLKDFIIYYLDVHTIIACSLKPTSIFYLSLSKVLRFGTFDHVNMLLFCRRGEIQSVPNCPTCLFSKSHIGVYCLLTQQFDIRILISRICNRYFMSFRL